MFAKDDHFDVKNASGISMTPEEVAVEIKKCKKTKKYITPFNLSSFFLETTNT